MFVCAPFFRGALRVGPWHGNELNVKTLRRRAVRLLKIERMREIMMIARDRFFLYVTNLNVATCVELNFAVKFVHFHPHFMLL